MVISFEVTSPCEGVVRKIARNLEEYVYERDLLLSVQAADGTISQVYAHFGGTLTQLFVQEGQTVSPNMVLASMTEKLSEVALGSD